GRDAAVRHRPAGRAGAAGVLARDRRRRVAGAPGRAVPGRARGRRRVRAGVRAARPADRAPRAERRRAHRHPPGPDARGARGAHRRGVARLPRRRRRHRARTRGRAAGGGARAGRGAARGARRDAMTPARAVLDLAARRGPRCGEVTVVLVDGPAGSGKTTLAAALEAAAGERGTGCTVVHMDDLYAGWRGLREGGAALTALLRDLADGAPAGYRRYD